MKLIFSFLIFVSTFTCIQSACNDGDFYHDGYCYITPLFDTKHGMTRFLGQEYCKQLGAFLPAFHNSEQENFVTLMAIRVFGKGYNWIGMFNGKWDDGSRVDYTNWDKGYPKYNSSCVMEYYNSKNSNEGKWRDDYDCDTKAKFFCQYSSSPTTVSTTVSTTTRPTMIPTTTTRQTTTRPTTTTQTTTRTTRYQYTTTRSGTCYSYDFKYGNRCYYFYYTAKAYRDAKGICSSLGMTLAILPTMEHVVAVDNYARTHFSPYYWIIGLHLNTTDNNYYWPDNSPLTYNNWNQASGDKTMVFQSTDDKWFTAYEDTSEPFICSGVL